MENEDTITNTMTPQEIWEKKVAKSNGTMVEFPKEMGAKADEFRKKSDEYLAKAKEFDRLNAEFDIFAKNFWHAVRIALEKEGVENIWGKNIGFNVDAKKDGIDVINLRDNNPQGMQMR